MDFGINLADAVVLQGRSGGILFLPNPGSEGVRPEMSEIDETCSRPLPDMVGSSHRSGRRKHLSKVLSLEHVS